MSALVTFPYLDILSNCIRFRLASSHIQSLCDHRRIKTEDNVRTALARLPEELNAIYSVIMEQISIQEEPNPDIAQATLKWLSCARRQLTSEEFLSAVNIGSQGQHFNLSNYTLLDICCNLIVYDSVQNVFGFAHLSVREYLEKDRRWNLASNALVLHRCLDATLGLSGEVEESVEHENAILFRYAFRYWPIHLRRTTSTGLDTELVQKLRRLWFTNCCEDLSFTKWLLVTPNFHQFYAAGMRKQIQSLFAFAGIYFLTNVNLSTKDLSLEKPRTNGDLFQILFPVNIEIEPRATRRPLSALHLAVSLDNERVARLLIEAGAELDIGGLRAYVTGNEFLRTAINGGSFGLIKLLPELQKTSLYNNSQRPIPPFSDREHTLRLVLETGSLKMVNLLLPFLARPCVPIVRSKELSITLSTVIETGNLEIFRALLNSGIYEDSSLDTRCYQLMFQTALATTSSINIAEYLLNSANDPEAVFIMAHDLQTAISSRSSEEVRRLLMSKNPLDDSSLDIRALFWEWEMRMRREPKLVRAWEAFRVRWNIRRVEKQKVTSKWTSQISRRRGRMVAIAVEDYAFLTTRPRRIVSKIYIFTGPTMNEGDPGAYFTFWCQNNRAKTLEPSKLLFVHDDMANFNADLLDRLLWQCFAVQPQNISESWKRLTVSPASVSMLATFAQEEARLLDSVSYKPAFDQIIESSLASQVSDVFRRNRPVIVGLLTRQPVPWVNSRSLIVTAISDEVPTGELEKDMKVLLSFQEHATDYLEVPVHFSAEVLGLETIVCYWSIPKDSRFNHKAIQGNFMVEVRQFGANLDHPKRTRPQSMILYPRSRRRRAPGFPSGMASEDKVYEFLKSLGAIATRALAGLVSS